MNTTQTGYTESDAKVTARMERRAWLNEIALADFWANEVFAKRRGSSPDVLTGALYVCMTDPAHKRDGEKRPSIFNKTDTNGNTEMEYVR